MNRFQRNEGMAPQMEVPMNITAREQDGGAATIVVRKRAPDERAERRAGQRRQGQECDGRRVDPVFDTHPGNDEAQTADLHGVDDERNRKRGASGPVPHRERRILRRGDPFVHQRSVGARLLGPQPVDGRGEPTQDAGHPARASPCPSACRPAGSAWTEPSRTSAGAGAHRSPPTACPARRPARCADRRT